MDRLVERLSSIGIPALIFFIIMSGTGLAGAAAITATLAILGPGGMIGGIITLLVLGSASSIIAKYGYEQITIEVVKRIMGTSIKWRKIS